MRTVRALARLAAAVALFVFVEIPARLALPIVRRFNAVLRRVLAHFGGEP